MTDILERAQKTKAETIEVLNEVFARRYHSVASYILNSSPYVTPEDQELLGRIQAIADYDSESIDKYIDAIESLGGIPYVPPFNHDVAEMNYLALPYLGTILAQKLAEQLAGAEKGLLPASQFPQVYELLLRTCETLRSQIASLDNAS